MSLTLILAMFTADALDYSGMYHKAMKERSPLVVGVGCAPPDGPWLVTFTKTLEGHKAPCIVVGKPDDGFMRLVSKLPATATADEVAKVVAPATKPAP